MVIGAKKKKKKKEPMIENLKKGLARSGKMVLDALGPLGQTSDLHTHQYPCYVIALSKLLKMDKLESHDDLLHKGMLEELTRTSMQKGPPWYTATARHTGHLGRRASALAACSPY
jgi:hypothetical protein